MDLLPSNTTLMEYQKDIPTVDIIVVCVILATFGSYYAYYAWTSRHPLYSTQTQLGRNLEVMVIWSQLHSEKQDVCDVCFGSIATK